MAEDHVIVIMFGSIQDFLPWVALWVAVLALIAAIAYPRAANRIASRALAIAESEKKAREREWGARARVAAGLERLYPPLEPDGVVYVGSGPGRYVGFRIATSGD